MERNQVALQGRERPEQAGGQGYVFRLDLLAQGVVRAAVKWGVIWKRELRKIDSRILFPDKVTVPVCRGPGRWTVSEWRCRV